MKVKIFILALSAFLLSSCGSARKIQTALMVNEKVSSDSSGEISTFVDTTKTASGAISIIEIDFFEDHIPLNFDPDSIPPGDPPISRPGKAIIDFNGIKISGSVKSAKITTITNSTTEAGISSRDSSYTSTEDRLVDTSINETEEPGKDPYRWKWIFGIGVLCMIGIVFLTAAFKKTKFWAVIKKALSL